MPPKRKNRVTKPAKAAATSKLHSTQTASTNGVSALKRRRSSVQAGKPSTSRLQPSEPLHMTTRGAARQASSQATSPAAAPSPSTVGDGINSRRSSLNGISNIIANGNDSADEDVVDTLQSRDSASRRNSQQMASFVSQVPDVQVDEQEIPIVDPPKTAGRKRKAPSADSNNATVINKAATTVNNLPSQVDSDQSEKQPRRKKRKTTNTPPEPVDAPPELTDDASTGPASPEEPIPEVAPSDTLQNVLPAGASDVPAKRRLPGRRRQPHANINVEVNLRRQLNLKMSYRKLAKEQKAVLEELAKRTLHNLHEDPNFHKEAAEYEHVMRQLDARLQQRLKEIRDERQIKLDQLERVRVAQEHIQREQFINRFKEFQQNYVLQCKYRMKQIERQMRAEQGEATDDEEHVVEATHMAFPLHDENDVLGSRYASRSRAYVETERMLRDDELRARLNQRRMSFVAANPDMDGEDIPTSFGNFSGPENEREEAFAHYNLATLVEAMEVDGESPAPTQGEVEPLKPGVDEEPRKIAFVETPPTVIPNDQAAALFLLASISAERPLQAEQPHQQEQEAAQSEQTQERLTRELSPVRAITPGKIDAPTSTIPVLPQNEEQANAKADLARQQEQNADLSVERIPAGHPEAAALSAELPTEHQNGASERPTELPTEKSATTANDLLASTSPRRPGTSELPVKSTKESISTRITELPAGLSSVKQGVKRQQDEESADYIPLDVGSDDQDDGLDNDDSSAGTGISLQQRVRFSENPQSSRDTADDTSVVLNAGEPMDLDQDKTNGGSSKQNVAAVPSKSLDRIEKAWGEKAIDELVKGRVGITQADLSNKEILDCLAQIATSEEVTVGDFIEAAIWDQEKNGPWSLGLRVPQIEDIKRVQQRLKETGESKKAGLPHTASDASTTNNAQTQTSRPDGEQTTEKKRRKSGEKPGKRPENERHLSRNQERIMSTPVNGLQVLEKLRALAREKAEGGEAAEWRPKDSPPLAADRGEQCDPAAESSQHEIVDLMSDVSEPAAHRCEDGHPAAGSSERKIADIFSHPYEARSGHHRDRLSMSSIVNDDRQQDEQVRRLSLPMPYQETPSARESISRHDPSLPLSRMRAMVKNLQDGADRPRVASVSEGRRLPWERGSLETTQAASYHTPAPAANTNPYGRDGDPKSSSSWDPSRRMSESAPSARPSVDRPELGGRTAARTPPTTTATPSSSRPPAGLPHPLSYPNPHRSRNSASSSSLPAKPAAPPPPQPPVNFRFAHYEPAPPRPASYQTGPPPPLPGFHGSHGRQAHQLPPPPPPVYHQSAAAPIPLPHTFIGVQQPAGGSSVGGYVPPPGSFQAPPPPPPLQQQQPPRTASPPVYPPLRITQYHDQAPPPTGYPPMGPPPPQGYAYATSPPQGHASPAPILGPAGAAGAGPQPGVQGQGQGQQGQQGGPGEARPRRQYRAYHAPETKFRPYQGPAGGRR
ncbi:uncharacterized protein EI97DRAFT_123269 [Westerdykella ornata]|uniref:Uncharacterized protein n=1 Tax=Westerdykella ornata TaxID=318751 RepID=A0A6A6JVM2_WESOR|nr:uncharacterized protein EI97DRAFT_123269 [Westerdykella ornata]KAF2280437.1 hypothetical protein EI97DRAFT_123269 [Westerdykella ornata]